MRSTDRSGRHAKGAANTEVLAYEKRLGRDLGWALSETSLFFEGGGAVQESLRRITSRLDQLGIAYAVSGAMAMFAHGFRRFTQDVDVLVTREGLREIHKQLDGFGYVPDFAGSKNLRDAQSGVRIDFLVAGQFPGGAPKPVAFPDPAAVAVVKDGIKYLSLPCLVDLKLASGMTRPDRMKDLADVMEVVKVLWLPAGFSEQLAPFVRDKYLEIWQSARPPRRYLMLWRNKPPAQDAAILAAMQADGVTVDSEGGAENGYVRLVTTDPDVARKYDMHEESEFLGQEQDEGDGEEQGGEEGESPSP